MHDLLGRRIHYLRVSVTDRCNLRCRYCMPENGVPFLPRTRILSFEEITTVVQAAVTLGVDKVRITGGEPLVRRDVLRLVERLGRIAGIRDLCMTTNGVLLEASAEALRKAGLMRINISLDAVNPDRYREVTRGGDVRRVIRGLQAAAKAGLNPIKINCVVESSADEADAQEVQAFADARGYMVRFIRRMDLARGQFWTVINGCGGDCPQCNRLRLTSDGYIRPCLFSDEQFSIRDLGPAAALRMAVAAKPVQGRTATQGCFSKIGG